MRTAFVSELCELAAQEPRIWLLCGDLGYSVLEPFRDRFPDRFVNVGVAEQNMIGVAAGLALSGQTVFVYSIANFPTLRCLEQIRNDVCYHQADVKVVSVGAGFSYGPQGFTHHGLHDVAAMRALPGMTVVAPGDPVEARQLTRSLARQSGPAYLRLGKAGEPVVHRGAVETPSGGACSPNAGAEAAIVLGRAVKLRDGDDLTLIGSGAVLSLALETADALAREGVRGRVLSMHTLKPLDVDALCAAAVETGGILTLEEHSRIGGLGSAVAEALLANDVPARLRVFAAPDRVMHEVGSQAYLRRLCGDPLALARELLAAPRGMTHETTRGKSASAARSSVTTERGPFATPPGVAAGTRFVSQTLPP
ncbi:MAG: 1-deoxy-D-xylulose-5-phosphate synthase [Phycisphaerae bacterium]|nr:1-deoxy-D-xylulose-5-phosphate synthase [Phycisphaerae bacterium]